MRTARIAIGILPLLVLAGGCFGPSEPTTPVGSPRDNPVGYTTPVSTEPVRELAPPPRQVTYLAITPAAARELKSHARDLQPGHWWLRFTIKGTGCTGFTDKLDLVTVPPTPQDFEFIADGIPCVVLHWQRPYVRGTRIDFGDNNGKRGFIVTHPEPVPCTIDVGGKCLTDESGTPAATKPPKNTN